MLMVLVSISLVAEPPADAPAREQAGLRARELIAAAKELFAERRYAEAIATFQESHALEASSSNVYNIGKCHERLREVPQALRWYREYLRLEPNAKDDPALQKDIAGTEAALAASGVQQLAVYVEPSIARVLVDGKALGPSSAYAELPAGAHEVTAEAEGYEPVTRTVVIELAHRQDVSLTLQPVGTPRARPPDGRVAHFDPYLARGRALAEALQFAEAVEELKVARSIRGGPPEERVELLELLATCVIAEGLRSEAEGAFTELLELKPDHQLAEGTSPKILEVFSELKHRLYPGEFLRLLPEVAPPGADRRVRVVDPYRQADHFTVVSRDDGGPWRESPVVPTNQELTLPLAVPLGHTIDWYLEARAPGGRVVGSMGTAEDPQQVSTALIGLPGVPRSPEATPRVRRVPAWVAVGLAVALGVAGAVLQAESVQLATSASSGRPPNDWANTARNTRAQSVTDAAVATGLFSGAGLAAATGVVFFVW